MSTNVFLLTVFILLQAGDGLTTWVGLQKPSFRETNPIVAWCFSKIGIPETLIIYKLFACASGAWLCYKGHRMVLIFLVVLYLAAVLNNLWLLVRSRS